jgi:hypothetical protein
MTDSNGQGILSRPVTASDYCREWWSFSKELNSGNVWLSDIAAKQEINPGRHMK